MPIEIKTLKIPTQCELWEKPELVDGPLKERFERLETYAHDSHLIRYLLKCRECGQLYFFEFYEWIDWEDGNDPQYTTYIPVDSQEQGNRLSGEDVVGLLTYFPRLRIGFPKDATKSSLGWVGK